ncbi:hypothetical protein D3H55_02715 [Bacillus salacetis]|uniref:Uncharacterized protein n=1 Tax=Bacillus salacetis TaxID=2315464 RepID=A0A3A1R5J2_9BACI|nr:hypothetical protein [Bacillus salacetis]RIW38466.1 hypothetical protein D3H55_02715 [Bacillus salacetis]
MSDFVESVKRFSKHLTSDIGTMIKDHQHKKIEFQDLVYLIMSHEKTRISSRLLLKNVYTTYVLHLFPYSLHLETKGDNHPIILQMKISSQEKKIFVWNSYNNQKGKAISVPKPLAAELISLQQSENLH